MDENGEETVDEDTYSFNAFDLVLLPANKGARLAMTESLDANRERFRKALKESLENSNEQDQKIMTSVLESLNIDLENPKSENEDEGAEVIEGTEASSTGDELVKNLQESLIENKRLQNQIIELQEKLSVSYTKEISQERDINKLKLAVKKLSESANKENAMSKQLQTLRTQLEEKVRENDRQRKVLERYKFKLTEAINSSKDMESTITTKATQINELNSKVKNLNENATHTVIEHRKELSNKDSEISSLKEQLEIKNSQYTKKLKSCNALVESYKKTANEAVNRYISMRATTLGVNANEIKNRLSENFTFDEIDEICESLRSYKRNMSKLPFSLTESLPRDSRMVIKNDPAAHIAANPDDVIDNSLLNLINN
jgi:myosin heavy subunit